MAGIPTWRLVLRSILLLFLTPALLIGASGDWRWTAGWTYSAILALSLLATWIVLGIRHPDLIAERATSLRAPGVSPWDRAFIAVAAFACPLATWAIAGLERRLGPAVALPGSIGWGAMGVVAASIAFVAWAMGVNRFFSAVVRIQADRGHATVTSGPYRLVRHPGYAGSIAMNLATPLALGSPWCAVPAGIAVVAILLRTAFEDRMLRAQLEGYEDYARRVRWRLLPGIW